MDIDARVEAWASLQLIPGLSSRALVALLKAFGGPAEVMAASRARLTRVVGADLASAIAHGAAPDELSRSLVWLAEPGHALLAWDDAAYPSALLTIGDPPPVLHYAGKLDLLNRPALAIVGSRNATPQGRENAAGWRRESTPPRTAAGLPAPAIASRLSVPESTAFIQPRTRRLHTAWPKKEACCRSSRWARRRYREISPAAIA